MNLRFPGQYFDRETNLAYNWHRSYDAQTGGYTTSDPIGLAGGQWSTYGYVDGQPTMKVDPEGLQFVLPGGAAGGFGGLGGFGGNAGNRSSSDNDPYGGLGQYMRDGGSTSGNASNSSSSSSAQQEQCKQPCPPCKLADGTVVPIGTIGYRWDVLPSNVVQHGIAGDHLNLYEVNQNPNNCKCFWKRGPTVRPPPLPGWIPIQPLM
jgi:RHS repeat-associated protein